MLDSDNTDVEFEELIRNNANVKPLVPILPKIRKSIIQRQILNGYNLVTSTPIKQNELQENTETPFAKYRQEKCELEAIGSTPSNETNNKSKKTPNRSNRRQSFGLTKEHLKLVIGSFKYNEQSNKSNHKSTHGHSAEIEPNHSRDACEGKSENELQKLSNNYYDKSNAVDQNLRTESKTSIDNNNEIVEEVNENKIETGPPNKSGRNVVGRNYSTSSDEDINEIVIRNTVNRSKAKNGTLKPAKRICSNSIQRFQSTNKSSHQENMNKSKNRTVRTFELSSSDDEIVISKGSVANTKKSTRQSECSSILQEHFQKLRPKMVALSSKSSTSSSEENVEKSSNKLKLLKKRRKNTKPQQTNPNNLGLGTDVNVVNTQCSHKLEKHGHNKLQSHHVNSISDYEDESDTDDNLPKTTKQCRTSKHLATVNKSTQSTATKPQRRNTVVQTSFCKPSETYFSDKKVLDTETHCNKLQSHHINSPSDYGDESDIEDNNFPKTTKQCRTSKHLATVNKSTQSTATKPQRRNTVVQTSFCKPSETYFSDKKVIDTETHCNKLQSHHINSPSDNGDESNIEDNNFPKTTKQCRISKHLATVHKSTQSTPLKPRRKNTVVQTSLNDPPESSSSDEQIIDIKTHRKEDTKKEKSRVKEYLGPKSRHQLDLKHTQTNKLTQNSKLPPCAEILKSAENNIKTKRKKIQRLFDESSSCEEKEDLEEVGSKVSDTKCNTIHSSAVKVLLEEWSTGDGANKDDKNSLKTPVGNEAHKTLHKSNTQTNFLGSAVKHRSQTSSACKSQNQNNRRSSQFKNAEVQNYVYSDNKRHTKYSDVKRFEIVRRKLSWNDEMESTENTKLPETSQKNENRERKNSLIKSNVINDSILSDKNHDMIEDPKDNACLSNIQPANESKNEILSADSMETHFDKKSSIKSHIDSPLPKTHIVLKPQKKIKILSNVPINMTDFQNQTQTSISRRHGRLTDTTNNIYKKLRPRKNVAEYTDADEADLEEDKNDLVMRKSRRLENAKTTTSSNSLRKSSMGPNKEDNNNLTSLLHIGSSVHSGSFTHFSNKGDNQPSVAQISNAEDKYCAEEDKVDVLSVQSLQNRVKNDLVTRKSRRLENAKTTTSSNSLRKSSMDPKKEDNNNLTSLLHTGSHKEDNQPSAAPIGNAEDKYCTPVVERHSEQNGNSRSKEVNVQSKGVADRLNGTHGKIDNDPLISHILTSTEHENAGGTNQSAMHTLLPNHKQESLLSETNKDITNSAIKERMLKSTPYVQIKISSEIQNSQTSTQKKTTSSRRSARKKVEKSNKSAKSDFVFTKPLPVGRVAKKGSSQSSLLTSTSQEESLSSTQTLRRSGRKRTTVERTPLIIECRQKYIANLAQYFDNYTIVEDIKSYKEMENAKKLRTSKRNITSSKENLSSDISDQTITKKKPRGQSKASSSAEVSTVEKKAKSRKKKVLAEVSADQEEATLGVTQEEGMTTSKRMSVRGRKKNTAAQQSKNDLPTVEEVCVQPTTECFQQAEIEGEFSNREPALSTRLSSDGISENEYFKRAKQYIATQENGVNIAMIMKTNSTQIGHFKISGNCKKAKQALTDSLMYLTVLKGRCKIAIRDASQVLEADDDAFVPLGATYSICNDNPDETAEILYISIKCDETS